MSDIEIVVEQPTNIVIVTAPMGLPGPTTFLGTLGGAGASAIFDISEILGGGDASGQ